MHKNNYYGTLQTDKEKPFYSVIMNKKIKYDPTITFTQQAYERIKDAIIEGTLKPGEKLKVQTFRDALAIGTAPIREALSQLVTTGLVTFTDNKGFRVATISEEDVRDVYATFTIIENIALRLSLELGDKEWEKRVETEFKTLEKIETRKTQASIAEWIEQNYRFHQALIAGCKLPTLIELQNLVYLKFDRYARMAYNLNPELSSKNHNEEKRIHHRELAELALKRDIQMAVKLMTYHINEPLKDIIKTLKDKKLI